MVVYVVVGFFNWEGFDAPLAVFSSHYEAARYANSQSGYDKVMVRELVLDSKIKKE